MTDRSDGAVDNSSVLVLFSGGLDSTVALAMARRRFERTLAVLFDYGQQSRIELDRAKAIAEWLDVELLEVALDMSAWGGSTLFGDNAAGAIEASIYVPARNLILLSVAAGIAEAQDLDAIWIGTNASESTFRDNSEEFFAALRVVFDRGLRRTKTGRSIRLGTPLSAMTKDRVVQAGLNEQAPLHLSWSCYGDGPEPCRDCLSCTQRREAFDAVGAIDPAAALPLPNKRRSDGPSDLVYLMSTLHAGSTMLSISLGSHPDIFAAGELLTLATDLADNHACSCGLTVHSCGFWSQVLGPHPELRFGDLGSMTALPVNESAYAEEALRVLAGVGVAAQTKVVLDSSKSVERFEAILTRRRLKALHLVRDGRALLDSARRYGRPYADVETAAEHWSKRNQRFAHFAAELGGDYLLVRYEDLCRDFEPQVARVIDWLGLERVPELESWTTVISHHLRGSVDRLDRKPVVEDLRWQSRISRHELDRFWDLAEPTLRRFGYEPL